MSANDARQTDTALPTTADMSSPQTYEAGVTRPPAESASRALSNYLSTFRWSPQVDGNVGGFPPLIGLTGACCEFGPHP